ncbi:hypothetical protein EAF04_002216 [Stromatinia cepivora]|nr:hypothetical protein EAF04_002216 [Stromatinia cepivora]
MGCPTGGHLTSQSLPYLGRTHKEKITKQLGLLRAQLSKLRFDKIGSLYIEGDKFHVKKCLSPALIWYRRDCLDEVSRGPFLSTKEFYESMLAAFLLHVKELPLEPHMFFAPLPKASEFETHSKYTSAVCRWNDYLTVGGKIDHSYNRLDYCIAVHYLRDMIPSIDVPASTIPSEFANGYPLHHPDLSSSNIFVDEDFNISCIIDWTFCSTVPMAMLLTTPSLPEPRSDIDSSLIPFFRSGFGHSTLAEQIWISAQRS